MTGAYRTATPPNDSDDYDAYVAEARREVRRRKLIERKLRLDAILDAAESAKHGGAERGIDAQFFAFGITGAAACIFMEWYRLALLCVVFYVVPALLMRFALLGARKLTVRALRRAGIDPVSLTELHAAGGPPNS